jgi:peroxiredoxin Q/BCP
LSAFRDDYARFERAGTEVIGINPQSLASHQKYTKKFEFPFPLVSDTKKETCSAYGVLKADGKGIERTVYVIGKDGNVVFAERGMPSDDDILKAIDAAP